jgi:murein DD-endopeptidase MepM/ murein hydrolase activator NlpD
MFERYLHHRKKITLIVLFLLVFGGIIFGAHTGLRWYQNRLKYSRVRTIKGNLEPGQVLYDAILSKNISPETAAEIINALDPILDLRALQVRDEFRIYLDQNNRLEKFIYEKSPIDQYFVVRDEYGGLHAFKPAIFLEKELLAKEFEIKTSLFDAMLQAGERDALVFEFVDVFAWDIDFYTYPRVGDKIRIYFEKYFKDGEFVKYGRILAAQYQGRETFNAVYFEPKNNYTGYYALDGKPAEKMFLKTPLKFTGRITSYFGLRRDPFTHRHGHHTGVDFASYYGAPIVATSDGSVTFTGWKGAYGKLVIVKHANGYSTYYGHCSNILVRPGQKVSQGQIIAKVGSTGRSTGPHCHYEIRIRSSAMNPLRFNQPKRKPLAGKDLEDFKSYSRKIWKNIEELGS